MASAQPLDRPAGLYHTTFLIPNLHCPTCVSHITWLVDDLKPRAIAENVSTVNHVITIAHDKALSAASIATELAAVGYEVFDIILDPASPEDVYREDVNELQFDSAVQRWHPNQQSMVDIATHSKHKDHCQLCAAYSTEKTNASDLDLVAIDDGMARTPRYLVTLSIDGMTCSSCVGNVTNALKSVTNVDRADVSLVSHSGRIDLRADNVDAVINDLTQAVEDVGYDVQVLEVKPLMARGIALATNKHVGYWEATYTIDGMSCSSCVGKVTELVKRLPFVERVDINLIAHSGTVVFERKENQPLILDAINNGGYKATLADLKSISEVKNITSRTVSLRIDGIHCPTCPKRILDAVQALHLDVVKPVTMNSPILTVTYLPAAPHMTIRKIIDTIADLDNSFSVSVHKPMSVEQRASQMMARERRSIFLRALLSIIVAIPTLIIGIVYMNLVSHHNAGYMYLMHQLQGVSRAEWATLVMATPVYFFAADHFHRRTLKELHALWRPRSEVKILKRFYRFGSMNMLISLGTTIAYFASLAQLITTATTKGGSVGGSSKKSYFDSVVFLTMFLLIGRLAEAHMKAKSGDAVSALRRLRPATAKLVMGKDGDNHLGVVEVDVDLIDVGDRMKIPHGSSPPCDGDLMDEVADFDESSLTGESRTVRKHAGESIFSGTINKGSAVTVRVTAPTGASLLDSIIQVVREGQSKRAPIEQIADLLTAYFVPVVVALAIVTWIVWLVLGISGALPDNYLDNSIGGWPFWSLQFAIAVFVIACPCGLGLAAPTALFVGGGMAAKRGILVKGGGEAFQEASDLDAVVFDKTGTLTNGVEPKIVQHSIFSDATDLGTSAILGLLKGIEENSGHPLAKAAVDFSASHSATEVQVRSADEITGKGLKAIFSLDIGHTDEQREALVGNEALMHDYAVQIPHVAESLLDSWKSKGYSVIIEAIRVANYWVLVGIFAASDPLRPEAADVVRSLQSSGLAVWMLSGDNINTAKAVGAQVGIHPDNIIAGVLPAQKADKMRHLQRSLKPRRRRDFLAVLTWKHRRAIVAMVGDGINDAPALAAADVGIAVASGSDVAMQSAAFVLVQSDLRAVLALVTLSRAVFRRVLLNFFWAAVYNMVALPIAAGVLYPIHTSGGSHVRLDPAWAALAMALSSISVISDSLLLRTRIPLVGFRG